MSKVALKLANLRPTDAGIWADNVELVDRSIELSRKLESTKTELEQCKAELREAAMGHRAKGDATVKLAGTDGASARVTWSEQYRDVDGGERDILLDALGRALTDAMFEEVVVAKLKPKADTTGLMEAMIAKKLDPRQWFKVGSAIRPVANFAEVVAGANDEAADDVRDQLQYAPKVYLK